MNFLLGWPIFRGYVLNLDLHQPTSSLLGVPKQDFKDADLTSNCHGLLLEAVGHPDVFVTSNEKIVKAKGVSAIHKMEMEKFEIETSLAGYVFIYHDDVKFCDS